MKKLLLILLTILGLITQLNAQVGINNTNTPPNDKAMLDVSSGTKGVLIPRLTAAQKAVISPVPIGLMVYDATLNQFSYFNGTVWVNVSGASGSAGPWAVTGNDIYFNNLGNVGINVTNPTPRLEVFQTGKTQSGFGSLVSPMRLGIGVTGLHAIAGDNYDAVGIAGFGANASSGKRNIGILGTTGGGIATNIGVMSYQNGSFVQNVYGNYNEVNQSGFGEPTASYNKVVNSGSSYATSVNGYAETNSNLPTTTTGGAFYGNNSGNNTGSICYGVNGVATGLGRNYGLYGYAGSGTHNYALYGAGDAVIQNNLLVGDYDLPTVPIGKLTVRASTNNYGLFHTDGVMSIGTYISSVRASIGTRSTHDLGFFTANGTSQIVLKTSGYVGIGTDAPVAPLHVNGNNLKYLSQGNFFFRDAAGISIEPTIGRFISIYSTDGIVAGTFVGAALSVTSSDNRIKKDFALSNNSEDLERLKKIEITNYRMKDVATWGNQTFKKVIAQQVESVYPEVIKKQTQVIPDIYALAESVVYDALNKKLSISLLKDYDIKIGDKIELVHPEKGKIQSEVVEVSGKSFTVKDWNYPTDKIFVFGREVNDFRSVDYEALSMLGISAIQALAKEVEVLKKENVKQKEDFNKRLEGIEASLKNLNISSIIK